MLGKLIKHEWKAASRLILPLYLVLAVFTLINSLMMRLDLYPNSGVLMLIPVLLIGGYVLSILGIMIMTLVTLILRFYKNLMTDEGYLMFTLPVRTHELITAKLLIACAWSVLSAIAVAASLFAVLGTPENMTLIRAGLRELFLQSEAMFGVHGSVLFAVLGVSVLVSLVHSILMVYASIALGQLAGKHRVLLSFAAYVALYTVIQIIGVIMVAVVGMPLNNQPESLANVARVVRQMMLSGIGLGAVLSVAYYWGTQFILKKRLNLE